ncbi:alpha/beta fold hydrolase [Mycobacterium talmoniae]|uniref:alpha/beta fold hydrolase n=1 Tax=Mycobacterium talmoniae TaxID=1858794 RepID=UPI000BA71B8A|nr:MULTISPECIES: alpha/beta hydrolase [Mycobacterium]TDH54715.1 alpha/beta hydrolase [Mycobacterium eburneum]
MISDDELAGLSEFALLSENAEQAGVAGPPPPVERVQVGGISALRWGAAAPRVVFLHGGAQNAHTWDTVILGLGEPAVAVDLPGHGRSGWREDGDYTPQQNAAALEPVLRELAPDADLLVGMSLGGLTAIRLAATAPDLVRQLAVVDVTPSALQRHSQMTPADRGTVELAHGPRTFPDFASILALAVAAAPHRDPKSLRRGIFHNAQRLPDGQWAWRYDTMRTFRDFAELWTDVSAITAPTTLIRGADSAFVSDADVDEYARRSPGLRSHVVADSGHSVQSDQPRALVDILRGVLDGR